jgi:hypothetical protein
MAWRQQRNLDHCVLLHRVALHLQMDFAADQSQWLLQPLPAKRSERAQVRGRLVRAQSWFAGWPAEHQLG